MYSLRTVEVSHSIDDAPHITVEVQGQLLTDADCVGHFEVVVVRRD